MSTKTRRIISLLLLLIMLPCFTLSSSAMTPSEPTHIQSSRSYGVIFPSECGVVIEGQTITYDIPTLPVIDTEAMVVEEYTGSVTTEYTLYNPTESEMRLSVVLPLSKIPSYDYGYTEPDVEKYTVATDGVAVDGFAPLNTPSDDRICVEYGYEIVIPPLSRVVHTVTAPIYPKVETAYEPPTYFYEYSFYEENAAMFSGEITVNINTTYHIIPNEYYAFEKTDDGYSLTMPASESFDDGTGYIAGGVYFTLCESEDPENVQKTLFANSVVFIVLIILLSPLITVFAVIYSIISGIVSTLSGFLGFFV